MNQFRKFWQEVVQRTDKAERSDKWRSCVEQVQRNSPNVNAYAVCTAKLGAESFKSQDEIDKMGAEGAGPVPSSLLAEQDLERTTKTSKQLGFLASEAEEAETTEEKEDLASKIARAQKQTQKKELNARKSFKDMWQTIKPR